MQVDAVAAWLTEHLRHPFILNKCLFGSFIKTPSIANDVDVFVMYSDGHVNDAIQIRDCLAAEFLKVFRVPIHLLLLSEVEVAEQEDLLSRLLKESLNLQKS